MATFLTLFILLKTYKCVATTSDIITTDSASKRNNFVDITIHPVQYNQTDQKYYSLIIINNDNNMIITAEKEFNIMILDEFNGSIVDNIKRNIYNSSYSVQLDIDIELSIYLSSAKQNNIILIIGIDIVIDRNPDFMLNVLNSFGCNISYIGYKKSFIFIGQNNAKHAPFWMYCDTKKIDLYCNDSIQTVQIPLLSTNDTSSNTYSNNINSTEYELHESVDRNRNIQIIVIISGIFISIIVSLSIGITTCFCICNSKNRVNTIIRTETENQINNNHQHKNKNLNDHEINKQRPEISDSHLIPPSVLSAIKWNPQTTLCINYENQHKPTLDIMDCVLNITNHHLINEKQITPKDDINDNKTRNPNESNIEELSDEMYENPDQFINDNIYTLKTRQSEQCSLSKQITMTAELEESGDV